MNPFVTTTESPMPSLSPQEDGLLKKACSEALVWIKKGNPLRAEVIMDEAMRRAHNLSSTRHASALW